MKKYFLISLIILLAGYTFRFKNTNFSIHTTYIIINYFTLSQCIVFLIIITILAKLVAKKLKSYRQSEHK